MKKDILIVLFAVALAVCSGLALAHDLFEYHAHETDGMMPVLISVLSLGFMAYAVFTLVRRRRWAALSVVLVCAAAVSLVLQNAWQIPLCVECQHLTKEDLGWLNRFISVPDFLK